MAGEHLSEFEKARARKLAQELRDMMEEDFLKPPEEARHPEMAVLREQIEKMGFIITCNRSFNPQTLELGVVVSLYFRE